MESSNNSDTLEDYKRYWKEKFERQKRELHERKKMLKEYAVKCSDLLKTKFHVKKVFLIGSLIGSHKIHKNSDIDLVVLGLKDEQYFTALKDLYHLVPKGVNIDLITEETASELMKIRIKKEGVAI